MLTGIVVTHSNLCEALIASVEKIVGPVEALVPLSNEEYSLKDLTAQIELKIREHSNSKGILIMVEFKGGSCYIAAKKASFQIKNSKQPLSSSKNTYLITGVNMPMLLTFVTKRDSLPLPELLHTIQEDGIQSISIEELNEKLSKL